MHLKYDTPADQSQKQLCDRPILIMRQLNSNAQQKGHPMGPIM
jgi:hypothetical protein